MTRTISVDQARRITLGAQGFAEKRPTGRVDRRHLRKVMNRLNLLQLDSVPVVIRTQYLPLFSRLGPYNTDLLDRVAYRDDEWFESWAHEASLLPVTAEPLMRWSKARAEAGETWKGLVDLAANEGAYVERVLEEVTDRGPLSAGDLSDPRPRSGDWWGARSMGQLALDWLFRIGAVGIRRTEGFEKRFDLLDRIVPAHIRAIPTPTEHEAHRELLMASARAFGIGTPACLIDYYRLPKREARQRLSELIEDGRLEVVTVRGLDRPSIWHPEARTPRTIGARALVSPFDPIVWNRDRAKALFDFEYRIEIYVPKHKRVYGYYVLPFLLGDRLVGRVDVKTDRAGRVLRVHAAYAEPDVDRAHVAAELRHELEALAALVGVDDVDIGERGDLASLLRAAR